jgi:hypothetical protein
MEQGSAMRQPNCQASPQTQKNKSGSSVHRTTLCGRAASVGTKGVSENAPVALAPLRGVEQRANRNHIEVKPKRKLFFLGFFPRVFIPALAHFQSLFAAALLRRDLTI